MSEKTTATMTAAELSRYIKSEEARHKLYMRKLRALQAVLEVEEGDDQTEE